MRPAPRLAGVTAYRVPGTKAPIDLDLRGNEGSRPDPALLVPDADALRRYPDAGPLEATLAGRHGVTPDRVIVTAGGDDALDRLCRAVLAPGRSAVVPTPGFEMTERYGRLAEGELITVRWEGAEFPAEAVLAAARPDTTLVVVTTPNNPTGAVATLDDVRRLSAALPGAVILVDLAYVEFADHDPTEAVLALPNTVVIRTFSKAWGLAGLRVGYAVGPAEVIGWMRASGAPYAVAAPSIAAAGRRLAQEPEMRAFVADVRAERAALAEALGALGAEVVPSQANFVFVRVRDALWLRDGMAGLGVGVRIFDRDGLRDAVRIGCPGGALPRVVAGLGAVLRPDALLLDMDGVLADVGASYRAAITAAAAAFGVEVTPDDIRRRKAAGDANNDWIVTHDLLRAAGVEVALDAVIEAFEAAYQGGLWRNETLIPARETLEALSLPVGIVTGRPRRDAERFVESFGLRADALVCMEDGPKKPDPWPVREALRRLGVASAWLVGDTPDDVRAARAAGVVPIGVLAPGDTDADALLCAGAARVIPDLSALLELLP